MRAAFLVCLTCLGMTGCQSFSSTAISRLEDNSLVGDSNGTPKAHNAGRPYKGIPITLKIPTHLDVYVDEVFYLQVAGKQATEPLANQLRILNVRTEMIKTDKVFTVDFKRPGAGILDLDMTFNDQQYFDKIVSKLEDETITQSAALVSSVIGGVKAFSTSADPPSPTTLQSLAAKGILRDTRVVAYQRFDLNSPSFEMEVEAFVHQHLNDCNKCNSARYDNAAQPRVKADEKSPLSSVHRARYSEPVRFAQGAPSAMTLFPSPQLD